MAHLHPDLDLAKQVAFLQHYLLGVFSVDDEGRVWRNKVFKSRGPQPITLADIEPRRAERVSKDGYLYLRTTHEGRRLMIMAHRLVWCVNFGIIPEGHEIDHQDGIKANNNPSNLVPVTPRTNVRNAWQAGLCSSPKGRFYRITRDDIEKMVALHSAGTSYRKIANDIGCSTGTVISHLRREHVLPN